MLFQMDAEHIHLDLSRREAINKGLANAFTYDCLTLCGEEKKNKQKEE